MKAVKICDVGPRRTLAFDLSDILAVIGPPALNSAWTVGKVEGCDEPLMATGSTEELDDLAKSQTRAGGHNLMTMLKGVRQVIWGSFKGYSSPSSPSPWIEIIAFDSTWF